MGARLGTAGWPGVPGFRNESVTTAVEAVGKPAKWSRGASIQPSRLQRSISWVALVTTGPQDPDLAWRGTRQFLRPGHAPIIIGVGALFL